MSNTTYATMWGSSAVAVSANWAQASSSVEGVEGGRQVADFRHDWDAALRTALEESAMAEGLDTEAADVIAQIDAAVASAVEAVEIDGTYYALATGGDTAHEDAAEWYSSYGAHISTEDHGDITVQAVDSDWLSNDLEDEAIAAKLRESYTDLSDDEAEGLIALARRVWESAQEVVSLLEEVVTAYESGDLDAVVAALDAAESAESDHGDWPATKMLRASLLTEVS